MLDAETLRLRGRLSRGARIRLSADNSAWRKWWTVQAAGSRYVIVTQQAPFRPEGDFIYAILDFETGARGVSDAVQEGIDVSQYPSAEIGWRLLHVALLDGRAEITTPVLQQPFSIVESLLICSACGERAEPDVEVEPLPEGNFCHSCAVATDVLFPGREVAVRRDGDLLHGRIVRQERSGYWLVEWSKPASLIVHRDRICVRPPAAGAGERAQ